MQHEGGHRGRRRTGPRPDRTAGRARRRRARARRRPTRSWCSSTNASMSAAVDRPVRAWRSRRCRRRSGSTARSPKTRRCGRAARRWSSAAPATAPAARSRSRCRRRRRPSASVGVGAAADAPHAGRPAPTGSCSSVSAVEARAQERGPTGSRAGRASSVRPVDLHAVDRTARTRTGSVLLRAESVRDGRRRRARPAGCSPCCRCSRAARTGAARSWPTASASPCAPCAATSTGCAGSATRSLAAIGVAGGYQLGSGGRAMPPLMLDRDEAVAVAVSLRSRPATWSPAAAQAAISALAKLDQLLPPDAAPPGRGDRRDDVAARRRARRRSTPNVLVTLSRACRDGERLRVRYRDARGPRDRPHARPVPARADAAPLVPRRPRPRPRRLADVPRRPLRRRRGDRPLVSRSSTRRTRWRSCRRRSRWRRTATRPVSSCSRRSTTVRPLVPADVRRLEPIDDRAHDADDRRRRPPPARVPPRRARRRLRRPRTGRAARRVARAVGRRSRAAALVDAARHLCSHCRGGTTTDWGIHVANALRHLHGTVPRAGGSEPDRRARPRRRHDPAARRARLRRGVDRRAPLVRHRDHRLARDLHRPRRRRRRGTSSSAPASCRCRTTTRCGWPTGRSCSTT